MNARRWLIGLLILGAVASGMIVVAEGIATAALADRREAISGLMRELKKGMPRDEVTQLISKHSRPFLKTRTDQDAIQVKTRVGIVTEWRLGITFVNGKLDRAFMWTENGPYHPAGAPPDIR